MIRVGTVRYLNAAPLVSDLDPARFLVTADHPRGIARALADGEVDLALAPVAAALTDGDLRIVPGLCIGADGPVASVLLVAETAPEAWTEVLLDGESRTSATLATLLLKEGPLAARVRGDLVIRTVEPGSSVPSAGGTVAAMVIGDSARTVPARMVERFDLAALWKDWTGLPFVFAVWAARPGFDPDVAAEIVAAGRAGVAAVASRYTGDDLVYLTEHIRYPLDDRALMGLRRYATLAKKHGLIGTDQISLLPPRARLPAKAPGLDAILADAADAAPSDPARLRRLIDDASDADLRLVAQLRRERIRDDDEASYLAATTLPLAGDPEAIAAAAASAGLVLRVPRALTDAASLLPLLTAAQAQGVEVGGWRIHGHADAVSLAWLAESGLTGVTLDGADLPADAVWGALAAEADLVLPPDDGALASVLARLTALGRVGLLAVNVHLPLPNGSLVEPSRATPAAWLRRLALTRVALPDAVHVTASLASQGDDFAQLGLSCGADDLGAVGADSVLLPDWAQVFTTDIATVERVVRAAGFTPIRRNHRFEAIGGALTTPRHVRRLEERSAR